MIEIDTIKKIGELTAHLVASKIRNLRNIDRVTRGRKLNGSIDQSWSRNRENKGMNFGNNQTLEYYENFMSQRDNDQKEREKRVKQGEKKERECRCWVQELLEGSEMHNKSEEEEEEIKIDWRGARLGRKIGKFWRIKNT